MSLNRNHASTRVGTRVGRVLVVLAALLLVGCEQSASRSEDVANPPVIRFGIVSTESTTGLRSGFEPLLEDLSKALGREVRPFFASDYAGVIEGMRFKKVDLAWFGNKSAIEAVDRANGEVFLQTRQSDGAPGYWSVVIAHRDHGLASIDDAIARADQLIFGNGDPHSTSGYLIPSYHLWAKRGLDPNRIFKRVVSANHESNCLAVANKHVHLATNNTEALERFRDSNPEEYKSLVVLWKSPLIPSDPLVWRRDLDSGLKDELRTFLLRYGREGADAERERAVLAEISGGWAPFEPSTDDQLLPVREIMLARELLQLDPEQSASQQRREELERRIAEIRARQAEIQLDAPTEASTDMNAAPSSAEE